MIALEIGHIFDEAEDRDVHFSKHRDRFSGVDHGDFLRGGDDDSAVEIDSLNDGELDITGAGWEVENEDVQLAPCDLHQKLLGVAVGEGATDDDGGIITEKKAHGHEL